MTHRVTPAIALLLGLAACIEEPCDSYVDYMCDCHGEDTGFDCAQLQDIYSGADPEVQDQCAIDLDNQKAQDELAGLDCTTGA